MLCRHLAHTRTHTPTRTHILMQARMHPHTYTRTCAPTYATSMSARAHPRAQAILHKNTNIQHVLALYFRDDVVAWAARRGSSSKSSEWRCPGAHARGVHGAACALSAERAGCARCIASWVRLQGGVRCGAASVGQGTALPRQHATTNTRLQRLTSLCATCPTPEAPSHTPLPPHPHRLGPPPTPPPSFLSRAQLLWPPSATRSSRAW